MTEAQRIAVYLNGHLPYVKAGALRFWGEWFGRLYDNIHRIVSGEAEDDLLKVNFRAGEVLSVWSPRGLEANKDTFRTSDSTKVRWEWFYYRRPKTEGNRYFMEFTNTGGAITAVTNVDWYTPNLQGNADAPAVEMI